MYPKIVHLYGPFEINSFNLLIMIGIGIFLYKALKHPGLERYISQHDFINISVEAALAGIMGGRLLHVISDLKNYPTFYDVISMWNGGLSILGALTGILLYSIISLKAKGIEILAVSDIAALYAPLVHATARIGCFLAGCCYGAPTSLPWAIEYTHPLVVAPLHIKIHPTQLYSSLIYIGLFFILHSLSKQYKPNTGVLLMSYLMGMSLERFFVDFFRGDRINVVHSSFSFLSFHQWVALSIFCIALIGLVVIRTTYHPKHPALKA
ncbi:prolipoprotein diacylglyceryl transferase [Candidatus Dependentiae bacterium]|nr:prolipoprotein diacylglyceryl transferase [Candidatus Dependentiae bacterium]